jgi:hypothetical protein
MFGEGVLVVAGLMYLGFGVAFVAAPAELGGWVHLGVDHPVARTEVRAFYGGLEIGLAVFLLLCAARREWAAPGLLATALAFGCTAAARVVGMVLDGSTGTVVIAILLVEVAFAAASAVALARTRPRRTEE